MVPLAEFYRLLEPEPVVLLTTARRGRPNVMTMSWHTMLEFEPPQVGCVVSDRNFSHAALKATRQCVIAIPTVELTAKVVRCGNCSGRDVDKFSTVGLAYLLVLQCDPQAPQALALAARAWPPQMPAGHPLDAVQGYLQALWQDGGEDIAAVRAARSAVERGYGHAPGRAAPLPPRLAGMF